MTFKPLEKFPMKDIAPSEDDDILGSKCWKVMYMIWLLL